MGAYWILALAAVGQAGDRWQADTWPAEPAQYNQPAAASTAPSSRFSSQPYSQPVAPPTSGYNYSDPRWGQAMQPAAAAATAPAGQQPSLPSYTQPPTAAWPEYAQPRTADNRGAANVNPYGGAQSPTATWNGQPATSLEPPPLLPPANAVPVTQPNWQQNGRYGQSGHAYGHQWNTDVDSAAALAAEYQAQVDNRWTYYAEFYRQPNPQLPLPDQWMPQPQDQLASGQTSSTQPAYDSRWNRQQQNAVAIQPDNIYPYNIYQPQPRLTADTGTTITKTVTDSRGTLTTIEPSLPSTLPTGADARGNRFSDAIGPPQPLADAAPRWTYETPRDAQPQFNQPYLSQPAVNQPNNNLFTGNQFTGAQGGVQQPGRVADTGAGAVNSSRGGFSENYAGNWNNNPQTTARVQNWPDNSATASANPDFTAGFGAPNSFGRGSTLDLLNALVPVDSRGARTVAYEQSLGGGKSSNSGLFDVGNPSGAAGDDEQDHDRAAGGDERPWAPMMVTLFGLFLSLGGNAYFGWIAAESHFRYRRLLVEGDEDGYDEEPRGRSSRDEDRESRRRRD